MELQSQLEATDAKISVFNILETQDKQPTMDGMNEYYEQRKQKDVISAKEEDYTKDKRVDIQSVRPKEGLQYGYSLHDPARAKSKASQNPTLKPIQSHGKGEPTTQENSIRDTTLHSILQKQNDITASLVLQQHHSLLPQKDIKVFEGDPVEYRSFLRAFEHAIEAKTLCDKDRLYYLEQYTRGQCRELVRTLPIHGSRKGIPKG